VFLFYLNEPHILSERIGEHSLPTGCNGVQRNFDEKRTNVKKGKPDVIEREFQEALSEVRKVNNVKAAVLMVANICLKQYFYYPLGRATVP
jgi:hypothetical protein